MKKFSIVSFLHLVCYITNSILTFPSVVEHYKLERFMDNKFWIGRAEWQLMIEEALENSMTSGREVKLQALLTSAFTFYATWRPGSMGWSHEEYRKRELVSKL
jgi:hypothetical protein